MTDQTATQATDLRQLIAEALREHGIMHPDERVFTGEHGCCADIVLAALLGPIPAGTDTAAWTAVRAIQLMNEAGRQRDEAQAAIERVRDELSACDDDAWMVRAGDIRRALNGEEEEGGR